MGHQSLRYDNDVLKIWEVPIERALAINDSEIWPLAGRMRGISVDRGLEVVERIVRTPLVRASQAELIGQLTLLAGG